MSPSAVADALFRAPRRPRLAPMERRGGRIRPRERLEAGEPSGSTFLYSDVGFVVLGELVQKVSGMTLDQYARAVGIRAAGYDIDALQSAADVGCRGSPLRSVTSTQVRRCVEPCMIRRRARWAVSPATPVCSRLLTTWRNLRRRFLNGGAPMSEFADRGEDDHTAAACELPQRARAGLGH